MRKLVKRIRTIARNAVHRRHAGIHRDLAGNPAGHPHRQGLHARRRHAAALSTDNVAAVEHEANKMARVSNRSSPLMETLGGIAIAARRDLWRLSRHRDAARRRAQFFSFITAFLLAYEPAKRLARLNIELNSRPCRRARILFEVIDAPAERSRSMPTSRS